MGDNPLETVIKPQSEKIPVKQVRSRMDLLVFCNQLNMIGVRYLSGFLRSKGVDVRLLYMISPVDSFKNILSDELCEKVCEFCQGADLIGLSITTNFYPEAQRLTGFLKKKIDAPVVWGGVHPTIEVEESLEYADYVVVGEGEKPVYELITLLAEKNDVTNIKNIAFKDKGLVVRNPLRALNDLDELPMPDIDFTSHYLIDDGQIKQITPELMRKHMLTLSNVPRVTYSISTTRGCPHSCTYCVNYALREIFGHNNYVRKRSFDKIMEELTEIIKKFHFIEYIFMADETFFIQDKDKIKQFAMLYKKNVGLPLKIEFSPETFNEEKLRYMLDSGAVELQMGIESGSDDTNYNIYNRKFPINRIKGILNSIEKYIQHLEVVNIHLLMCNPFEKSSNTRETFRLVANISNNFRIRFFPLVLFPGTKLLDMAEASGLIKDRQKDVYAKTWRIRDSLALADYYTLCSIFLYKLKQHFRVNKAFSLLFYYFTSFLPVRFILGSKIGREGLARAYLIAQKIWKRTTLGLRNKAMFTCLNNIKIIVESPFSKRDFQRFGIEIMRSNGFNVEVWDLSYTLYPGLDLTPRDPFNFHGLRIFKNKQEVVDSIMALGPDTMIILGLDYVYLRFFWIYRTMSRSKVQYSVLQQCAPVVYCGFNEPLVSKLKRLFARRSLKTCFTIVRDKLFRAIYPKFLGIKPPAFWFAGTDRSLEFYSFPSDLSTKIVYIHAFDYDLYLEKKQDNSLKLPANAVFLDSYLPFHEDDKMVGVPHGVSSGEYYPSLRRFFDYVEKEQGIKVDIAAHPRSFYEKHPDYFGKRILRVGQTFESVRDAKFIIAHDSTALNFAVIYNKPIIFIITQEMIRNHSAKMVHMMASWFDKQPVNIDKDLNVNWINELRVDGDNYARFKNYFIKKKGTPEINSWETVLVSLGTKRHKE